MAKRTLGYVELEWNCPNCGSKNPGMQKACGQCGAPQPQEVQFALGEKRELIQDAAKAQAAGQGADIHCPYCGTRNPAEAVTCAQCGGDLKEGVKRASGQVLGSPAVNAAGQVKCPSCGTVNPSTNGTCAACGALLRPATGPVSTPKTVTPAPAGNAFFRPWMALPLIAILMVVCVIAGIFLFRTETKLGVVQTVEWQRTIQIEALRDVSREAWRDQVPAAAREVSCTEKYRTRQDNPAPNSKEVCATAYVDKGNGVAEVVETCYYEVYDDYCKYTVQEWRPVDQAVAQGQDLQPYWPQVSLATGQREGAREENYSVYFETDAGVKEYHPGDEAFFAQFQPNSEWQLSVNTFGQVVEVAP